MATRNRTLVFTQYRNEKKSFRKTPVKREGTKDKLLQEPKSYELEDIEQGKKDTPPPSWMSLIDDINYDISRIKTKMNELSECHKKHLLPQFGVDDRVEDEQSIEILTEHITKMFQQAQLKVQRIGGDGIKKQEESIKKNVQSSLASQLQELSVVFRKNQKDYLQRKGRQQQNRMFSIEDGTDQDEDFSVSFTDAQQKALSSADETVTQRVRDIQQIAKSIKELATIFNDLAFLVIEQGTILDRIDFNIEQTHDNVNSAVTSLVKTRDSQKSYRNKLLMMLLCLGILIMVIVILLKAFL